MRTTGQDTKERIERAAIRMFVRNGVDGASIRDIAIEASVSQGALYTHYPSKEDLAWNLFRQSWHEMGRNLRERARGATGLLEQLTAMVRYVFVSFEEDWELVTYTYLSRHQHLRRVTGAVTNPYLVFRLVIVEAMTRGEIPHQDADLATAMVMGTIVQVMDMKILGRVKPALSENVDNVAAACARLLGAHVPETGKPVLEQAR